MHPTVEPAVVYDNNSMRIATMRNSSTCKITISLSAYVLSHDTTDSPILSTAPELESSGSCEGD